MKTTLKAEFNLSQNILKIIRPINNRLILIRDEMPKFTELGLEIPDTSTSFVPYSGKVIISGAYCTEIKPDMHVLFSKGSGTELEIDNTKFVILREPDVLLETTQMKVFGDKVLVTPEKRPERIKSIIIPDTVEDQPQIGRVEATGAACTEVTPGRPVLFGRFAGLVITHLKRKYIVMREADIFAILQEEDFA